MISRQRLLLPLLLPLLGLLLSACGGSSSGSGNRPSYGLDGRPANSSCLAQDVSLGSLGVTAQRVFPALNFSEPVQMLQAPGAEGHWYVLEKAGRLRRFANQADAGSTSLALDLSASVHDGGEGGLLGMAFAPDFASSGEAYLYFTTPSTIGGSYKSVLVRFHSPDGGASFTPGSAQTLLEVVQPWPIHNAGALHFGPLDGYLYLGLGDGGPTEYAQDDRYLLGTFVRIDVSGSGSSYGIPTDNPHAGNPLCAQGEGALPCPEIFATGFRNPWQWSFDRETGALWVGDVGQGAREEINLVTLGGNYGWPHREGMICYQPQSGCQSAGLTDPVLDYLNPSEGGAVTGGYVYRGTAMPGLYGRYLFADFVSGRVWVLVADDQGGYDKLQLLQVDFNPVSFAQDQQGELYLVDYNGGLYQLVPGDGGDAGDASLPEWLSATGCVNPAAPWLPASGLVPYEINVPFWSDGADKARWLAIPDGTRIQVGTDGHLQFPAGSVLMKNFVRDQVLLETRLFMRHPQGNWAGYTYAWNAEQTDAQRVQGGALVDVLGEPWLFPSQAQCLQCHTAAGGRALGLSLAQLNLEMTYPSTGRTANQLRSLQSVGLLSGLPQQLPSMVDPARAYLHSNCAGCHRPGGPTQSGMDLRYQIPLSAMAACDLPPLTGDSLGITDARLIAPGDAQRSLIWARMARRDAHAMPPVGSLLVDAEGADLIAAWIDQLDQCQ